MIAAHAAAESLTVEAVGAMYVESTCRGVSRASSLRVQEVADLVIYLGYGPSGRVTHQRAGDRGDLDGRP